jgi:ferritin-like metal-binding protein YciE
MNTPQEQFLDGLAEIYDAKSRLVCCMPPMVAAAASADLQDAVAAHQLESAEHAERLEGIFDSLHERARRRTSETTIAILEECHEIMPALKGSHLVDLALIDLLQKIEHYEIGLYGRLRDSAAALGHEEEAGILQGILDEDTAANQSLIYLAHSLEHPEELSDKATALIPRLAPADADQQMGGDLARFETESPMHERSPDRVTLTESSREISHLRSLSNGSDAADGKRRRTTEGEPPYERQHRFVD